MILLGPPGLGKTHLAIGLGVKAAQAGYSVLFDTATNWITRLAAAHHTGQLEAELKKIRRYKLIIIDEVGYIPFDQDAANLFFQLVASRYEEGFDHGHLQPASLSSKPNLLSFEKSLTGRCQGIDEEQLLPAGEKLIEQNDDNGDDREHDDGTKQQQGAHFSIV